MTDLQIEVPTLSATTPAAFVAAGIGGIRMHPPGYHRHRFEEKFIGPLVPSAIARARGLSSGAVVFADRDAYEKALHGGRVAGPMRTSPDSAGRITYRRASEIVANPAFLRDLLTDGPMPAKMVKADGDAAGHAWRTLHRAADKLNVEITKGGMRGGWTWKLPPKVPNNSEDATKLRQENMAPSSDLGTFGSEPDTEF